MPSFRRLALASTITTILLVAIGGLVRATDSGLGCGDDWPDCNGKLIPVLNAKPIIIEWSHRAVAGAVGILVALLVVKALREHRNRPAIVGASIGAFALVILQALLGRVVVKEELEVLLVVAHMTTAMLFLGVLITIVVMEGRTDPKVAPGLDPAVARRALFAAGAVLALLMVGSYTSDFGYMPGWPFQHGRIIPNLGDEREAIHFFHRGLAAIVAVIVVYASVGTTRKRGLLDPPAIWFARAGAGLFAIELLVGAANVWTTLHPIVVTLHLALGALVWSSMIGLWAITSPALSDFVRRSGRVAPELADRTGGDTHVAGVRS
jgi:heme a synthase